MLRTALLATALFFIANEMSFAQSAPRPADGSYAYRWSAGDQIVGQATVTVRQHGNQLTVNTASMINKGALAQARITFGPRLGLESYSGFASSNGTDLSIDLALQNGALIGSTKTQAVTYPINYVPSALSPVVAVDDGLLGTFVLLPAQMNAGGYRSFAVLTALSGTIGSIGYATSTFGPYPYGVPSNDVVVTIGPDTILWYNPRTFVLDQFARADLVARLLGRT